MLYQTASWRHTRTPLLEGAAGSHSGIQGASPKDEAVGRATEWHRGVSPPAPPPPSIPLGTPSKRPGEDPWHTSRRRRLEPLRLRKTLTPTSPRSFRKPPTPACAPAAGTPSLRGARALPPRCRLQGLWANEGGAHPRAPGSPRTGRMQKVSE